MRSRSRTPWPRPRRCRGVVAAGHRGQPGGLPGAGGTAHAEPAGRRRSRAYAGAACGARRGHHAGDRREGDRAKGDRVAYAHERRGAGELREPGPGDGAVDGRRAAGSRRRAAGDLRPHASRAARRERADGGGRCDLGQHREPGERSGSATFAAANGPRIAAAGLTQADIDRMFSFRALVKDLEARLATDKPKRVSDLMAMDAAAVWAPPRRRSASGPGRGPRRG